MLNRSSVSKNKFDIKNWTLWRATRMILGMVFAVVGAMRLDYILAAAGVFLIFHAWINHCAACVDDSCEVPAKSTRFRG